MSNSLFDDSALRAASLALDGLSLRQEIIGRNLANVDTPGYRAQTVDFETTIQQAMKHGASIGLQATHATHFAVPTPVPAFRAVPRQGGSLRADQNNVDVDVELAQMSETGIQYQAVSQEISQKLLLLKAIAGGA
ncbi:MAG: flagellar basal body rod protein FlgB [Chloroflexi bacterium]|nr:flagellar basal body rod protein FlgB [Chloroflexota bacterium]